MGWNLMILLCATHPSLNSIKIIKTNSQPDYLKIKDNED